MDGGRQGRRRSLPRVPIYASNHDSDQSDQWSPYSPGASSSGPVPGKPQVMDQFDEYFYKSTHIGESLPAAQYPPEVNIEVPSDSDSSRRPSKYTLSNASSTHDFSEVSHHRTNFQPQAYQATFQEPLGKKLTVVHSEMYPKDEFTRKQNPCQEMTIFD